MKIVIVLLFTLHSVKNIEVKILKIKPDIEFFRNSRLPCIIIVYRMYLSIIAVNLKAIYFIISQRIQDRDRHHLEVQLTMKVMFRIYTVKVANERKKKLNTFSICHIKFKLLSSIYLYKALLFYY